MDGLGAGRFRCGNHRIDPQVAVGRGGASNLYGFADHLHMQGVGVGCGVNAGNRDPEPMAGSRDPAGDLAAIGNQDFLEHGTISSVITS